MSQIELEDLLHGCQDWYICTECDTALKGAKDLNDHMAQHHQIRLNAQDMMLDTSLINQDNNSINNNNKNNVQVSGQQYLKNKAMKSQKDYVYSELKNALDTISTQRNKPYLGTNLATSIDILDDINRIKNTCVQLGLNGHNNDNLKFLDFHQNRILTNNKKNKVFKQPPYKIHTKKSTSNDTNNNNNNDMDMDMNDKQNNDIKFEFDSTDFQIFLDANAEILNKLNLIRKEKTFYGVTNEETELASKFTKNTTNILKYGDIPGGFLI